MAISDFLAVIIIFCTRETEIEETTIKTVYENVSVLKETQLLGNYSGFNKDLKNKPACDKE